MVPRGVEGDEDESAGEVGGVEGGDVGRGGGGEEVEGGGGRGVEEWREVAAEAAGGDGGGVEEGLCEDGSCGELVARFVRVLHDEDARGGWDRVQGQRVAETHATWTVAVGADGTTLRQR